MPGLSNLDLPRGLACDPRGQCEPANVISALIEALERPEFYDLRERGGELFVTPKGSAEPMLA
jgi:hypothetical protein